MPDTPAGHLLPVAAMTEIDGVIAVYSSAADQVLVLSETASSVWRLLDGVRSERQVVEALAERYGVEPDSIAADVSSMLTSLRDGGLLETRDGGEDAAR